MIIKRDGECVSIEEIQRLFIFSEGNGNIHLHVRSKLINPIRLPNNSLDGCGQIEDFYTSPRLAFSFIKTPEIYHFLEADFDLGPEGLKEAMRPSTKYSLLTEYTVVGKRYTPDAQLKEIEKYFDFIFEDNVLTFGVINKKVKMANRLIVIGDFEQIEKLERKVDEITGKWEIDFKEKTKLIRVDLQKKLNLKYIERKKIGCSELDIYKIENKIYIDFPCLEREGYLYTRLADGIYLGLKDNYYIGAIVGKRLKLYVDENASSLIIRLISSV